MGFNVKMAPGCRVQILGMPSDVGTGAEVDLLREFLQQYKVNEAQSDLDRPDNVARSIAHCGAIRPGLELNVDEMRTLVDRLFQCSQPFQAPDGRPTLIQITLDELKHRFGPERQTHESASDL